MNQSGYYPNQGYPQAYPAQQPPQGWGAPPAQPSQQQQGWGNPPAQNAPQQGWGQNPPQQQNNAGGNNERKTYSFMSLFRAVSTDGSPYIGVVVKGWPFDMDKELTQTANGKSVLHCKLPISNRGKMIETLSGCAPTEKDGVVFAQVSMFEKTAERFLSFTQKHPKPEVCFTGSMKVTQNTSQKNGQTYVNVQITANDFFLVRDAKNSTGASAEGNGGYTAPQGYQPAAGYQPAQQPPQQPTQGWGAPPAQGAAPAQNAPQQGWGQAPQPTQQPSQPNQQPQQGWGNPPVQAAAPASAPMPYAAPQTDANGFINLDMDCDALPF